MRAAENSNYSGYLYLDGKFVGERQDRVASGISRRPFRSWETLLKALDQGIPGKLIVECEIDCPEGGTFLPAAWRDQPYEPLQLSEAVGRLPTRLRSRLLAIQRRDFDAEFEG